MTKRISMLPCIFWVATALMGSTAAAQTFNLLYSFQGPSDGMTPNGEVILDRSGNLYGTTADGGSSRLAVGTAFELDNTGKETTLYSFSGTAGDGTYPVGKIVRRGDDIYGVTASGGECSLSTAGCGIMFKITAGEETIVHTFTAVDGSSPVGGLVASGSGKLYGVTAQGSIGSPPQGCGVLGCGVVFEFDGNKVTPIYSFGGVPDGADPEAGLIVDSGGNLFGTTNLGGAFNWGTIFELSPQLDGTWTEQVLYSFTGKRDGAEPRGGLAMDAKHNLYGTTLIGGHFHTVGPCRPGCGVVFKLKQISGGVWAEKVLHLFGDTDDDGQEPYGRLVRDPHGNLYGVTLGGGIAGLGVVFEIDTSANERILHTFGGAPDDGARPSAGLTIDSAGNLYGTTAQGGSGSALACVSGNPQGCGTVFKVTP